MTRYAIVVIGYNRADSISRLLVSLAQGIYSESVDLLISIDNSGTDTVEKCATEFEWKFGNKKVFTYPSRLGLRRHILHCGDFLKNYEAIAVFEDDVVPSPGFFNYMKATVEKYSGDENVAGISLYGIQWNQTVNKPFEPTNAGDDVYFMQLAQSWGQIWMRKQWYDFIDWYNTFTDTSFDNANVPPNVRGWPNTSWLKYHIRYCIERKKYFVYPYVSLTTCFSEVGQNTKQESALLQVSYLASEKKNYKLPAYEDAIKYDAYMERQLEDVDCDLYGGKEVYQKAKVLSIRPLSYKIISTYGLLLRPHEMNYINKIPGEIIKLYDTTQPCKLSNRTWEMEEFKYRFRVYNQARQMFVYLRQRLKKKFFK